MSFLDIFLIGIGLSMDAFAVAVCKGLSMTKLNYRNGFTIALFFGGFQALMPLIGFYLGTFFEKYIVSFDHYIAFVLLAYIGGKMLWETLTSKEDCEGGCKIMYKLNIKEILILAIATSIDALAVGITFSFYKNLSIWQSVSLIGVTTFVISLGGVIIGNKFGTKFKSKAEVCGGVILILIGLKILLEGIGIL